MSQIKGNAMPQPQAPTVEPAQETAEIVRLAPQYRVLIHNDDATPMDFVVAVLLNNFRMEFDAAMRVMWEAHHGGVALVVVLPLEEAEFRVDQAHAKARTAKFPLTFTYEPE